jgi:signal transduction histidine kinase/ActR/RegA family two-component response regulator
MSIPDLTDPETEQMSFDVLSKVRKTGRASTEVILKPKDGSVIWVSLDAVALSEDRYMAFCSDITETKRLRELESRAERLETAGTIAGQVAHDFNNLLAPIIAYPEFIHEELPHDHKAHAYLDAIEDAASKIAVINQDLLTMGRRGHYNQEIFDLNRVVLQAAREMESRSKTVTVELDLCEDLLNTKGGAAQIHRMITNLLVNAQDAMDGIGQITVSTENYYADDTSIAFGRVPKGEYIKLTVSDNGCGIPDDIIQKILDPFFSTKTTDKKRGSGLGLSVVDAVMKDHNGYLDLSSNVGQGTSFYLYFPVSREGSSEKVPEHLMGGTERILIVDDDDIQRSVSSRLLDKLGYEVNAVESGEKALEFLRENPQDLIILDMVMPGGIDGTETYRRILELNPHQKAIMLSGFSESDRVLEAQALGAGAFVKKPVTKAEIAASVRTELDRPIKELAT